MEQSTKEAWRRLLDEARRELPDATVRTWLEPAVPIALDDGRLIVGAPDQFAVEWNESKHATVLARAAERVFGRPTAVVFRVQEDRQQRPQMDFFVAPREPATVDRSGVPTTPLNERYTFQTFVIGKANDRAPAAATSPFDFPVTRSEEHTSELQSRLHLVCRLLLEKKKLLARTTLASTATRLRRQPLAPAYAIAFLSRHTSKSSGTSIPTDA